MITQAMYDAAVMELTRKGFSRELAQREVTKQLGKPGDADKDVPPNRSASAIVRVPLPFTVVLPWSVLISDNARAIPVPIDATKARLILTPEYKAARQTIQSLLRTAMGAGHNEASEYAPVDEPVQLLARVFVPDNRIHDVPDFAKGVHDAMARQVFTNDAWIHRAVWERAGVDVDRPRAEITISPFG